MHFDRLQQMTFENIMKKGEIAQNDQFETYLQYERHMKDINISLKFIIRLLNRVENIVT